MVEFGGRFARTTWALTAICAVTAVWAAAAVRIQRFCSPRGTPSRPVCWGEWREGLGYDRGRQGSALTSRRRGRWTASIVCPNLALPLAASFRPAGMLMIVGAVWTPTEARSPQEPPKRPIHGPNYRPPYAAIVFDDKSGFVLHEVMRRTAPPASADQDHELYLLSSNRGRQARLDTELADLDAGALQEIHQARLKANQTIKSRTRSRLVTNRERRRGRCR